MTIPLLPTATAVWLVDKTALTFEQISDFCGMHLMEVQGIADGKVAASISGKNPIVSQQLTKEEIERCVANPKAKLTLQKEMQRFIDKEQNKKKKSRYTPVARRQDKPDAILWLVKNYPEIKDTQITKLIGTTKNTIAGIRERTHWNYSNLTARDPVLLALCSQRDLNLIIEKLEKDAEETANKSETA